MKDSQILAPVDVLFDAVYTSPSPTSGSSSFATPPVTLDQSSPGSPRVVMERGGAAVGTALTPGAAAPSSKPIPGSGGKSLAAELGVAGTSSLLTMRFPGLGGRAPSPVKASAALAAASSAAAVVVKVGGGDVEGNKEVGETEAKKRPASSMNCCLPLAFLAFCLALALGLGLGLGLSLKPSGGAAVPGSPTPSSAPSASPKKANVTKLVNLVSVGWGVSFPFNDTRPHAQAHPSIRTPPPPLFPFYFPHHHRPPMSPPWSPPTRRLPP